MDIGVCIDAYAPMAVIEFPTKVHDQACIFKMTMASHQVEVKDIMRGEAVKRYLKFSNKGSVDGKFELAYDSKSLKLEPATGIIRAGSELKVAWRSISPTRYHNLFYQVGAIFETKSEGPHRNIVTVRMEGLQPRTIDFSWTVTVPKFEVILEGTNVPMQKSVSIHAPHQQYCAVEHIFR